NGSEGDWKYRGDSNDILADIAEINVGAKKPVFGSNLRCSGCHTLGGPIMKELEPPHNDWWTTKHKLELKPWKLKAGTDRTDPANLADQLFQNAADASNLSGLVKAGTQRLLEARLQRPLAGLTLKHQLRSLFSTMEMNLVSDSVPYRDRVVAGQAVEIPA